MWVSWNSISAPKKSTCYRYVVMDLSALIDKLCIYFKVDFFLKFRNVNRVENEQGLNMVLQYSFLYLCLKKQLISNLIWLAILTYFCIYWIFIYSYLHLLLTFFIIEIKSKIFLKKILLKLSMPIMNSKIRITICKWFDDLHLVY